MRLFGSIIMGLAYLVIIAHLIVLPTDDFKVKLYKGQRADTLININSDVFGDTLSVERFPLDTLALVPLKVVPHIDVSFSPTVRKVEGRPKPYCEKIIKTNSLGYCYLLSLNQASIPLPVTDLKSRVVAYDVSNYVNDVTFSIDNLNMNLMSNNAQNEFLSVMSQLANSNCQAVENISADCIVELEREGQVRYVYCYYVNDLGSFVYDPEHPSNFSSKIDEDGYHCLTEIWTPVKYYKRTEK